jgi:hypothetical protein
MSKTILKTLAVVAFAMIAGYNVYQAHSETDGMSELMLANVEALAGYEYNPNISYGYRLEECKDSEGIITGVNVLYILENQNVIIK